MLIKDNSVTSLKEAKIKFDNKEAVVIRKKIASDLLTPVRVLLGVKEHFPDYHFLYESVEKGNHKSRYSVIGLKPDLIFKSYEDNSFINREADTQINKFDKIANQTPLQNLKSLIKESAIKDSESFLPSGLFGYMSYDMIRLMEDIKDGKLQDEINIPDSIFIRPKILIIFDSLYDVLTISCPIYYDKSKNAEVCYDEAISQIDNITNIISKQIPATKATSDKKKYDFSYNLREDEYCNLVEKSKKYIEDGDIFQVLPSIRVSTDFDKNDDFSFYRSLRSINPSPFLFYLKFDDFSFMGSSPEIMVSLKEKKVTVRPLAGTKKRGKNDLEDQKISKELLSDEKEIAEHLMLIDLGRHDVGKVSKENSVKVSDKMIIENYSHVMHISSTVEGIIRDNLEALDVLVSAFPAGTVSGAPKIRAMQVIEELEKIKRSFYAGCVGYFASNGDMETCITLRSALVKNGKIYLQSGAGVVYDSIAKNEYNECLNKLAALIKAFDNISDY